MIDESALDPWLKAARRDVARRTPDAMSHQRLVSRWSERRALHSVAAVRDVAACPVPTTATHRGRSWRSLAFGIPLALSVVFAVAVGALLLVPAAQPLAIESRATPFIALASADDLAGAVEPLLVSSQVPRMTLADYGLPVDPARVDQPVDAEFLLSRTGVVLAVRFKE
jgi:hypothetical protein